MAGTGNEVTNTEGHVQIQEYYGEDNAASIVVKKFSDTITYATEMQQKVSDILDTLSADIGTFTLPSTWKDALQNVSIPNIPVFSMQAQTFLGTLTLDDNWPSTFPTLPTLSSPPSLDFSYTKPTGPDDVNPTISYTPATYSSDIYLSVYTSIYNQLQSGGYGLTTTVEQAILDRGTERQRLLNEKKYEEDMRAAGATGFDFPSGVISGIAMDSQTEILQQNTGFNLDATIQSLQMSQKNYELALQQGNALEQSLKDFYGNNENRKLEIQKATGDLILRVYSAKVQKYIADWQGIREDLNVKLGQLDVVLKNNQILIDAFKVQASGYVSQVEATTKKIEGQVAGYKGKVDAYVAETQALEAYYNVLAENEKVQIQAASLELQKAIAEMDATLKGTLGIYNLQEKITDTAGRIAEQAVASSLNAVSASASLGMSASVGVSESYGHSDSISESHSYQHDPTT